MTQPTKILIVKLGAMGDVLRTTPLLAAYKSAYPASEITWLVDRGSAEVLEANPLIDRLLVTGPETDRELARARFDIAINLDKEKEALDAVAAARAASKKGFGWNAAKNAVAPLNPSSEYAVRLGLDDELKFRLNRKTYQEISFEQAEMAYSGEEYLLRLGADDLAAARAHLERLGAGTGAVGINTGSGDRFAGKRLAAAQIVKLSELIAKRLGRPALLLGGPRETERNIRIEALARPFAVNAGTDHPIRRFAALVSNLALVITGDTIAMHVAIAVKVPVVAFFGSTCAQEIELYGRGVKIVSPISCAPCYKKVCPIDDQCMTGMDVERIFEEARGLAAAEPVPQRPAKR